MDEQKVQSFSLYMDMAPLVKAMDSDTAAKWIWAVFRFIDGIDTDTISDDSFVNAFWEQTKIKLQISIDKAIKRSADAKRAVAKREENRNDRYQGISTDNDRYQGISPVPTIQNINSNSTVLHKDSTDTVTVLQERGSGAAHPADAGAAVSPFTFAEVRECAEEYGINMTTKQLRNFYSWMEKYHWTINGQKVARLENALAGYARKHGVRETPAEKPKTRPVEREAPSRVSDRMETEPAELPEKPKKKELTADDISLEELFGEECKGL